MNGSSKLTSYEDEDEVDQHDVVPPGWRVRLLRQDCQSQAEWDARAGVEDDAGGDDAARLAVAEVVRKPGIARSHPPDRDHFLREL